MSHGPPSQPYSASPATNAAAPSSLSQPRTVAAGTVNLGGRLICRRRSHLDLSDPLCPPLAVELLMATLYSLDG